MNAQACRAAAALLLAGAGAAQGDPAALVAALGQADELVAERALRELCALPKAQVPLALLHAAARQERSHEPAMLVLAWFGAVEPDDVQAEDRRHPLLAAPALGCLRDGELRTLVRDATAPLLCRRTALELLQDRSAATAADLIAAIGSDEELMRTALYVLRWEWPAVPPEVLAALRAQPVPRMAFLQLLADAPRPGCGAWARECAGAAELDAAERLFALAGIGTGLDLEQGRFALRTIAAQDGPQVGLSFRCAMGRLPAKVAAELVGEAHRLCMQGTTVEMLMPFFDRLDQDGEVRLLGLAAALPPAAQEQLTWFLSQRSSEGYLARVRAALDGAIPLEPHLLPRTPSLLDRPARVQRVLAMLDNEGTQPAARRHAFELLVSAGAPVARLLPYVAAADSDERWVHLLRYYPAALPADVLQQALDCQRARLAAFAAMEQHGPPRALEPYLLQVVEEGTGQDRTAAARVLSVAGSEAAATELWRVVRNRAGLREQVLDWFGLGKRPWVHELLLAELARKDAPENTDAAQVQALRARVRALLVELGDRRELRELLAEADKVGAHWLRRARLSAPDLSVEQARGLLPLLERVRDTEVAIELVLWLSRCSDAQVQQRLQELFRQTGEPDLEEETLRALMAGPSRNALLAELDQAIGQGPLDEHAELLAFAAVDLPPGQRPDAKDLLRWARLYLWSPLQAPAAELARALRFPDGRVGYPMAKAIAQELRRDPALDAGRAFRAVADLVAADPRARCLGRQRILCLWQAAVAEPQVQRALGRATADLLLQIPDPRRPGEALGHLLAGEAAAAAGRFDPAAEHFLSAVRGLLRGGSAGMAVRVVLGDRDAADFSDPQAALAAAPWLCRARALLARSDRTGAVRELNAALELGWSDLATRTTVSAMMEQLR